MRARRILIALDGSAESRAALTAAAKLGISTGAELSGLFIEDVELLRLAGLPFAIEVGLSPEMRRSLDPADVERRFRYAAERAREALREVAEASALASSFRVARGRVVPVLLAAARDAEVVAAGKRGGHRTGRRLGATGRSLIVQLQAPVLVGGVQGRSPGPAVVISSTREMPEEALGFAALLARAFGAPEVVAIACKGEPVAPRPEKNGAGFRRRGFASISPPTVMALPEVANASAVVLVRPEGVAGHQLLVALTEAVTCPVFVIGPHGLAELLSA